MPNLESLPLDVAYNIFSQLYQGPQSKLHPYLTLSTVSKTLNGLIEAYSAHLVAARRARFPRTKVPLTLKGTNRQRLLQLNWTLCEFCNKKSARRAILAHELVCCKKCDQDEWPTKITMTDACKRYHLKQPDLFDAGIRYGQYYGVTGLTTLFLEHEVREVATRVHAGPGGDLAMYLALRASQSVERKVKQEVAREAKKVHLRQVLVANGLPDTTLVTKLSPLLFPVHNQRAAMAVLDIVRMQILEHRLDAELGYRQSEHGPSPTSSYVAREQARVWDTRVVDNIPRTFSYMFGNQSHIQVNSVYKQVQDSRDKALFELFCKEFGLFPEYLQENVPEGEHSSDKEIDIYLLYKDHRRMWTSVSSAKRALEMPKHPIISSGRRMRWEATIMETHAPWSFAKYPVLVKDVPVDDLDAGTATLDPKKAAEKEKERKKIIKWNAGAEREMNRITALIKDRWLDIECWCKLKKPQYEVGEVEAADALQVLREGGRDIIVLD